MVNEMQEFNFHNLEVRTLIIDNEPWFVGKDVASALGYSNTKDALIRHVDDEDRQGSRFTTSGQNREMTVINESGVYSLIFGSKLPSAQQFKRWLTTEVLPSIRKTGGYQTEPQFRLPVNMAEMTQVVTAIAEESNKRIDDVDKRVTELAENEEIRSWERKTLLEIRKDKVRSYLVGIQDPVRYKEARTQLYRAISQDFKKHFMLPAYDALPRKAFEAGKDFMRNWTPDDWTRAAIAGMEIG